MGEGINQNGPKGWKERCDIDRKIGKARERKDVRDRRMQDRRKWGEEEKERRKKWIN